MASSPPPWTKQKNLPIDIEILPDGTVIGTVGDAALTDGKLEKKNWIYTHIFQHENAYRIKADLRGDIIKDEGIQRDSVVMSIRVDGSKINGGLGTSGSKTGGKESMMLSVMDVSLTKIHPQPDKSNQNSQVITNNYSALN